MVHFMKMFS